MKPLKIRKTKIVPKVQIKKATSASKTHKIKRVNTRRNKNTVEITVHEGISLPSQNQLFPSEQRDMIATQNIRKANELSKKKSNPHLLPKKTFWKLIALIAGATCVLVAILCIVFLA